MYREREDRQDRNPNRERETPNRNPQGPAREDQDKSWRQGNE